MESQNQPPIPQTLFGIRPPLPNSTAVLVLGIISLVFSVLWCYWIGSFIAIVLGIVGLALSRGGEKIYNANPNAYSTTSHNNLSAGKVCGIIGLVFGSLGMIVLLAIIIGGLALGSIFPESRWE